MLNILYIEDDLRAHDNLCLVLGDKYNTICAACGEEGLKRLADSQIDLILLDITLPDKHGLDVLKIIHQGVNPPPIIMLTAHNDVKLVVNAIKLGAFDYIVKPFILSELKQKIREAVLAGELLNSNSNPDSSDYLQDFIGESPPIRQIKHMILKYAHTQHPVLIEGESGTGKEVIARNIHRCSSRTGPFIPVNCGAIPEPLVEAELFGAEKGAFTGAKTRKGYFEAAQGGTLFLDEIGEMPAGAQVKLLRVLESKTVSPLGSCLTKPVDTRIIAATNKVLKQVLPQKQFREDLYYRINVLSIKLPPLRERKQDIPLLATYFLDRSQYNQTDKKILTSSALCRLKEYAWPGNIRELKNAIERAIVLSESNRITASDIQF